MMYDLEAAGCRRQRRRTAAVATKITASSQIVKGPERGCSEPSCRPGTVPWS